MIFCCVACGGAGVNAAWRGKGCGLQRRMKRSGSAGSCSRLSKVKRKCFGDFCVTVIMHGQRSFAFVTTASPLSANARSS